MNKKKAIRYSIEAAVIIMMIVTFVIVNDMINERNAKRETEGYQYSVDLLKYYDETGEVEIKGWYIKEGVDCATPESRQRLKVFLAENGDMDKSIEIPVTSVERKDITNRYGEGVNDYTYSGFSGTVKTDATIKDKRYRVVIQNDSSVEKYFYTYKYLNNGVLTTEYEQFDYKK